MSTQKAPSLAPLSPAEFKLFNRMAETMQALVSVTPLPSQLIFCLLTIETAPMVSSSMEYYL